MWLSYIILYITYGLLSVLSNGENIYKYYDSLNKIGTILLVDLKIEKYVSIIYFYLFIGVIIGHSTRLSMLIAHYGHSNMTEHLLSSFLLMSVSLTFFNRAIMFELLWNRMRTLRQTMENHVDFTFNEDERKHKLVISKVQEYLLIYNKLLRNTRHIGGSSKFIIKVIFYIEAVFILLLPLVPSFFAELIRFEISKIKTHLKKQLLVCSGEFSRNKILDALTFLRLNPFVFSVWRLFNVDITLPLTLVSVCTTYIIVLIQLKQLY
ncbi:uncharacterized protein LOC133319451 [Danaus plexippus]|uniref:uncharacterized protein LOC133319451 n=1 Tax=Danaus plexippus TaxID=13037 RepID=UPI002AB3169E|nr:uncharacterized protein LOC133319451 [Danaus plexippus]